MRYHINIINLSDKQTCYLKLIDTDIISIRLLYYL